MGIPVPRKSLPTLVGIAPDSCIRVVAPPSRPRLGTMVGGFGTSHFDIEIDVELEREPEPANDVSDLDQAWNVVQAQWLDSDVCLEPEPISERRPIAPPPRASAAITLPSVREAQPTGSGKDIVIVLISATAMLSVIALMAALL